MSLTNENLPPKEFSQRLRDEFIVHRVGKGKRKQVLFTGYYAPKMQASRVKTKKYRHPIYSIPESSPRPQLIGHSTNHKIHESLSHSHLKKLTNIYQNILENYFKKKSDSI